MRLSSFACGLLFGLIAQLSMANAAGPESSGTMNDLSWDSWTLFVFLASELFYGLFFGALLIRKGLRQNSSGLENNYFNDSVEGEVTVIFPNGEQRNMRSSLKALPEFAYDPEAGAHRLNLSIL